MAYRKKIEYWLEKDCKFWGNKISLELIEAKSTEYTWHLKHKHTIYEITYSDIGEITLSALPLKYWPGSFIRDIYQGNNSRQSYNSMISLLQDNFVNS